MNEQPINKQCFKKIWMPAFAGMTAWLWALALPAQDESPAIKNFDEQPAVSTKPEPQAAPRPAPRPGTGTTVIGEQESPIGLYIMPWRNSAATGGLERPARLLDVELLPLDRDVFRRQIEYHRALSEHLEKQGLVTPIEK